MVQDNSHVLLNNLLYSCVDKMQRANEQFVQDHVLGYILSGETHVTDAAAVNIFKAGTIGLVKRNQLLKSVKVPSPGGEFKAINIFFSQDILRKYSKENNIHCTENNAHRMADSVRHSYNDGPSAGNYAVPSYRLLPQDPFLKGYFESLLPYFEAPGRINAVIAEIKTIEAIELVLKADPALKELLFDFSEPYKIDLEAFMLQHYKYNVSVAAFAKLTGRSRAGFKRDFEKVFRTSPGHWLQQRRLQEAYYLIKEKGIKPSSVYLDVGFENLSHFSFAFKKAFGIAPSLLSGV